MQDVPEHSHVEEEEPLQEQPELVAGADIVICIFMCELWYLVSILSRANDNANDYQLEVDRYHEIGSVYIYFQKNIMERKDENVSVLKSGYQGGVIIAVTPSKKMMNNLWFLHD